MTNKKQVIFRLDEATITRLRHYCIDQQTTIQEIMENHVKQLIKTNV